MKVFLINLSSHEASRTNNFETEEYIFKFDEDDEEENYFAQKGVSFGGAHWHIKDGEFATLDETDFYFRMIDCNDDSIPTRVHGFLAKTISMFIGLANKDEVFYLETNLKDNIKITCTVKCLYIGNVKDVPLFLQFDKEETIAGFGDYNIQPLHPDWLEEGAIVYSNVHKKYVYVHSFFESNDKNASTLLCNVSNDNSYSIAIQELKPIKSFRCYTTEEAKKLLGKVLTYYNDKETNELVTSIMLASDGKMLINHRTFQWLHDHKATVDDVPIGVIEP